MQLITHLHFNGNCETAFKFYEQALGGKIETMMLHEGTPAADHVPPEWRKKILHASLTVGDQWLMGADAPPEHYQPPRGFSVAIQIKDQAEAEAHLQGVVGERQGYDAAAGNLLGPAFWHAGRPIRHTMAGQLR